MPSFSSPACRRGPSSARSVALFLLFVVIAAAGLAPAAAAVRVVAVPLVAAQSHLRVMWAVVQQLALRGNEVALLVVEPNISVAASLLAKAPPAVASRVALVPYADAAPPGWWSAYMLAQAGGGAAPAVGTGHVRAWVAQSDAMLSDPALMAALRAWGPDAVLGDIAFLATTGLAAALGVPFATLSCTGPVDPLHSDLLDMENPVSSIPQFGTGLVPPLDVKGVAANAAAWVAGRAFFRYVWHAIWQPVALKHRIPLLGSPASASNELVHLFNADFALEWPRSVPEKVQFVGPILACNTTEKIPAKMQAILDSTPEKVILVSFGTSVILGPEICRTIAAGLAALTPPVPVLWKLEPSDLGGADPVAVLGPLPSHITLHTWVPQNALLQSGRVGAFMTQGGLNSIHEAAYHGVPVVGLPFFGDQADNVAKAVGRGMGIGLGTPSRMRAGAVEAALHALRINPAYRAAAAAVSVRLRARPDGPARVLAADLVQRATEDWHAVRALEAEVEGATKGVE